MAMFDEMDKKISGWISAGVGKAKDMSESMKISGLIKEEENKQNEIFKQIGQLYFVNYADHAEGQLKEMCLKIADSKASVMQYKEQLCALKGTIGCPNCGAEISSNSMFCSACGAKIELPRKQQNGKICSNCGAVVEEGAIFCTSCGTKIVAQSTEGDKKSENNQSLEEQDLVKSEIEQEKICPQCGKKLEIGQTFCTNCGTRID